MASTDRHVRLTSAALGSSAVLLSMQGFEALGRISEFHVEFLSLDNNLAPADVLGKDLSLTVDFPPVSGDGIKGQREFTGIITLMRLIAAGDTTKNLMARYHVVVHPRLWLLTQASHRRFYYQRTVREIVTSILAACNIDFRD